MKKGMEKEKSIFNLFEKNNEKANLSKIEVENIFVLLKGFLKMGFPPLEAIKLLSENEENKKVKEVLTSIQFETLEKNRQLQSVLLAKGMINPLEHTIMTKSLSMGKSIDTILEMRKNSSKVEKAILAVFAFPLIALLVILGAIGFWGKDILDFVEFLQRMSAMTSGSAGGIKSFKLKTDELPFFLLYTTEIKYVFFAYIGVLFTIIYGYFKLYKTNTKLLYKLMPLKVYDDAPVLFQIMYNLKQTGIPASELFSEMAKNAEPAPLRAMFIDINKKIEKNRPFYTVFSQYGFPKNIVSIIEIGEKTYTIWKNLPDLIEFTKITGESKIKILKVGIGTVLKYAAQILILYVVLMSFLAVMMTATSMMG